MKTTSIFIIALAWLLGITVFCGTTASAKTDNLTYTVAKTPDWVVKQSYNPDGFADIEHGNAPYLLYTQQIVFGQQDISAYTREARRINNTKGAESTSQITINFDPTYQKLTIHNLIITRDGVSENRLEENTFNLYRIETDADRLIYNGTVTASTVLDDIREGDIVEYAYTITGRNNYFKGSVEYFLRLQYGIPIDRHFLRLSVPDDRKYQTRLYANAPEPEIFQVSGNKIFEWKFNQQVKLDVDNDRPNWHLGYPYFQITDRTDWSDVGQWKPDLYGPAPKISAELSTEIRKISNKYSAPEERIAAVLKFVQREIRYLGIEIGEGGYIPRDPSKVYARRYGDCKDKARLMVTMLDRMDIQASALLVHTDQRQGVDIYLPRLSAFDHVITRVELEGKSWFLDPTKGEQFGDLDALEQSYFGKGVEIATKSDGIIDINLQNSFPYSQDTAETFSFGATSKSTNLTVVTKLYGNAADRFLRWRSDDGIDAISKNYLEHYQKSYADVSVKEPILISSHPEKALVEVTESYTILNPWQQDDDEKPDFNLTFEADPTSLSGIFPSVNKTPRTAPLAIKHRKNIRHTLVFNTPKGWTFDTSGLEIDNDSFFFKKTESNTDNVYTETYIYRSKKDHITSKNLQAIMKDIEKVNDAWGVKFSSGNQYLSVEAKQEEATTELLLGLAVILGAIIYIGLMIFGLIKAAKYDEAWRAEGVFYPMALWKFLLLTTLSLGIYVTFWFFKNWQWVRDVREKKIWAFTRAVFYPFMSFALFNHMNKEEKTGLKWFRAISIPIALLIVLASVFDGISGAWDGAPLWISLISYPMVFVLVPAVMHVNAMNDRDGIAYKNNSRITWHSVLFIAMTLPLAGLIIFDMFPA
jgi:transglutaminase-like putative cysteine protease